MTDRAVHAFHTTNWTQVIAASGKSPPARQALRELCEAYYAPVELFVRRFRSARNAGQSDDARDMTHEFFAKLLEGNSLGHVDATRGRFRSYLLGAVKNFLSDQFDRERAVKRGGGQTPQSLDQHESDSEFGTSAALEVVDPQGFPPDAWFDRQWALTVVERAIASLRADAEARGEILNFEVLQRWLVTPSSHDTAIEAARSLNLSEGAFKVAVHRLRKKFRHVVTERIAHTVGYSAEVQDELSSLIAALSQSAI